MKEKFEYNEQPTVSAEDEDEAVDGLQHEMSELLGGQELRLPVRLDLVSLQHQSILVFSWEIYIFRYLRINVSSDF